MGWLFARARSAAARRCAFRARLQSGLSCERLEERRVLAAPVAENDSYSTTKSEIFSVGTSVSQAFDTDVAGAAAFNATYPQFTFSAPNGGDVSVINGRIELTGTGGGHEQLVVTSGNPGDMTVIADLSADASPGGFHIGIRIGENEIAFHPGYPNAAFRVAGPGGFGNTNIGWTPALGVLHRLQVRMDADTGTFFVTLIDGANPNNVYSTQFVNAASVGGQVSLVRSGPTAGKGLYDNVSINWGGVLANDYDPEGQTLSVVGVNGTPLLTGASSLGATVTLTTDGRLTYDPSTSPTIQALGIGQIVFDSFTYTASDGVEISQATVNVTVTGANVPPDAQDDTIIVSEDSIANSTTTYAQLFTTNAGAGMFGGTYPDFYGATNIATVTGGVVNIPNGESELYWSGPTPAGNVYSVSVNIGSTAAPGSYNVGLRIGENSIVFHPGLGGGAFRVEGPNGFGNQTMNFTPALNTLYNFKVTVNKLTGQFTINVTNTANPAQVYTASFTNMNSVNGPIALRRSGPNVGAGIYSNFQVGYPALTSNDIDLNNDPLTVVSYSTVSALGAPVVVNSNGTFTYDPRAVPAIQALPQGATGSDSFTYTVTDGQGGFDTATVNVTIIGMNDPPVANDDVYNITEDQILNIAAGAPNGLFANDHAGGDTGDTIVVSAYQAVSARGVPVVVNADGSFIYNPTNLPIIQAIPHGATLVDTFTYTVRDGAGATDPATVTIHITGVNDAPIAENNSSSTNEDTAISVGSALFEPFNTNVTGAAAFAAAYPNLTFSAPNGGDISVVNGRVELTGIAASNFDQLVIAGPRAGDFTVYADIGTDSQPGGFNVGLRIGDNKIVFHPGLGGGAFRVEGPGGFGNQTMPWTPALNVLHRVKVQVDADTGLFTITMIDGNNPNNIYIQSFTNPGSVGGSVAVVRSGPTTGRGLFDNFRVTAGTLVDNARDDGFGPLTITQFNGTGSLTGTTALGATVTLQADGRYTYNPTTSAVLQTLNIGQSRVDTFTYTVSDGAATTTATASITVTGVNDAPVFVTSGGSFSGSEGSPVVVPVLATVRDPDANAVLTYTLNWGDGTPTQSGSVTITSAGVDLPTLGSIGGTHTFPNDGTYTGTLTVTDGASAPIVSTFTVVVANVPPTAVIDEAQTVGVPGMPLSFVFSATDPSPADEAAGFTYYVDWGDGSDPVEITDPQVDPLTLAHIFPAIGSYTVSVWAIDQNGEMSVEPAEVEVTIRAYVTVDGVLYVGGTDTGDRIILSSGSGGVIIRMNNVASKPQPVGSKIVVFGNGGDDTITAPTNLPFIMEFYGGEGNDYLSGGARNDLLDGGDGSDRLMGNAGHDTLLGGAGADLLYGGAGNDTLYGDDMIDLVGGTELADGSISWPGDIIPSGDAGRDTLNGDAGNDTLYGGAGPDTLNGAAGNDYLDGGEGDDTLDGGDGSDLLLGGEGADKLNGRAGADVLIGGDGMDTLLGGNGADLLFGGMYDESLDLAALWLAHSTSASSGAAANMLADYAFDDGSPDTLGGEADADWYLVYLSAYDSIRTAAELKAPNKVRNLSL